MRRSFVILVAMMALLTGCEPSQPPKENPDVGGPPPRFEIVNAEYLGYEKYTVIRDTQTGREYLYIEGTQGRGGVVELRGEE